MNMKLLLVMAIASAPWTQALYAEGSNTIEENEEIAEEAEESEEEYDDQEESTDAEDEYPSEDFVEGGELLSAYTDTPLSIQIQTGRKWYKNGDFNIDVFEFITEWYLFDNFPMKVGPTLAYNNLTSLSNGVVDGQILELGLRSSIFWDFGIWSPYVAMKYTTLSSGSIDIKNQISPFLMERGTLDLKVTGLDLMIGTQFKVAKQIYLTLETSLYNHEKISRSGRIGLVTKDEDTNDLSADTKELSVSTRKKFRSLSFGILFEL